MEKDTIEESSNKVLTKADSSTAVERQTFGKLYHEFRANGLSVLDSTFNSLYIRHTEKLCAKHKTDSSVFAQPTGWYKGLSESEKKASDAKSIKLLEAWAKIMSPFSRSVKSVKRHLKTSGESKNLVIKNITRFVKKAVPVGAALVCAAIVFGSFYTKSEMATVVEFSVNGQPIGTVASVKTIDEAIDSLNAEISQITGKTFCFPCEVSYAFKEMPSGNCMDVNEVYEKLYEYADEYTVEGYGLYIDSRLIAVMSSRDDIEDVLDTVKNERMELIGEEGSIANDINIEFKEYSPDALITKEELLSMFAPEVIEEEEETTTVYRALLSQPAEVPTISFEGATPEFQEAVETTLAENDDSAIVLDIETISTEVIEEVIPYETTYEEDNNYYVGQEVIAVTGKNGYGENIYEVKRINDVEVSRELIEQKVAKQPRTCVVKVGTRALPEKLSYYTSSEKYMINPVPTALITSRYGGRMLRGQSDFHYGLDLAAPTGTPIYATATGTVIFAGYNGSWGNHVKIQHPDGIITLYAHCSELLVVTGDVVAQGAEIGLVGSTGNSTGPHCHLEVILDGERVDPEPFLVEK